MYNFLAENLHIGIPIYLKKLFKKKQNRDNLHSAILFIREHLYNIEIIQTTMIPLLDME